MSLALLLMMLTTMTAWADDVNLSEDNDIAVGTAGHYYVNMPKTGTNTLEITAQDIADGKGTFKVYDDGGKSGIYSNDCNGNLVLIAPTGYLLQLSGSVTTDGDKDKLTVYNNNEASGTKLIDAVYGTTNINTSSTSNFITLNFTTNAVFQGVGFDLTVTLVVAPTTDYNVIINTAEGGSVTATPTSAKINEAITLTATPGNEYMLSGISVTDGSSNPVAVTWDGPFSNTATFTMPGSDVTVTPTFTNDLTNLSINMPKTGEKDVIIPSYVQSFKVYDDGGKDGNYSQNCTGTLVLTAPEGYVLQLSGSVTLDYNNEKLTVYNGTKANDDKLIDAFSCSESNTKTDIPMATSKGNVMTIYFETNNFYEYAGLDLTVTVVSTSTDYTINGLGSATGGSISASVGGENATTAKANDVVTLTATPENGYLLSGISVTDASSNPIAVTGGKWYDNTATFTMPGSVATVTPTFTDDMTDLSVNMPTTGEKDVTIPSGVESFKVYDDGGENGTYSQNCTGTLVLTAPENHLLRLSGKITTDAYDYLTVYDGSKENGSKLLNEVRSTSSDTETDIVPVTSKGNVMTIYFYTNNFYEEAGLDLTVTVVNPNTEYNVNVINPAEGGSVTASPTSAKVNETVTLTATPASGYLLSGISVTDAGSNPIAVTWDGPLDNTVTFTMPGSNVTVTPTFTDNLTAAGGLYINMPTTNNNYNELTIPSGVRSFKVYDDGGENGTYSNNYEGTLVLTAPEGYVLQLSGGITTESSDKLTVYDNSEASGTKLIDAMDGNNSTKKDFEPVTSTGNVMTIYFISDYSMTYAGLDLTVTLFKDIAACDITVPNQTLSAYSTVYNSDRSYDHIFIKFEEANSPASFGVSVGETVEDGETTLTLGTDYTFGNVYYSDMTGMNEPQKIGDECLVEIVGIGKYTGTAYAPFRIIVPDASDDDWETDFKWAYHDGKLTISKKDGVDGNKAMPEKSDNTQYPWYSIANGIFEVNIEEGITSVAANAFAGTSNVHSYGNLASVSLPSTLTTIGNNAFAFDSALPSVEIPASVTSIGTTAFNQCGNLNSVKLNSNPTIGESAFPSGATVTMNLAAAEVDDAKWTTFYNNYGNFQADENTEVYKGAVSESKLVLTAISDKIVTKEQAVILKSTSTPIVMTLTATASTGDYSDNELKGLSVRTLTSDVKTNYSANTIYVMGNKSNKFGFHRYTGAYMPANKAFLALGSGSSAPLRMVIDDDEETTGVASMADGIDNMSDVWYTLDGRKLNCKPTTKGLYIVNGKKVMIK